VKVLINNQALFTSPEGERAPLYVHSRYIRKRTFSLQYKLLASWYIEKFIASHHFQYKLNTGNVTSDNNLEERYKESLLYLSADVHARVFTSAKI
jgi:hypothetical protein